MTPSFHIEPSWKWGTSEGSREFDRLLDRSLTFREKLEWLEEMETLTLRMHASRMEHNPVRASDSNPTESQGSPELNDSPAHPTRPCIKQK